MANRIIKSLDWRKIILIFCILEVDFAIPVITLFVVFDESFQKALVDKSVCVINITLLIVLSAFKNPLFDAYFNRITALLAAIFFPVMRAYLGPTALFASGFPLVMRAYLTSFTLPALIFVFFVFTKIFQIMRCSGFGVHILNSFFHFYIKQKNLNSFFHNLKKPKISEFLIFENFRFLRISDFWEFLIFENFWFLRISDFWEFLIFENFWFLRISVFWEFQFFENFRFLRILDFWEFQIFENFRFLRILDFWEFQIFENFRFLRILDFSEF